MPIEITKSELVNIIENDESAKYFGTIEVGTETRKYYRTAFGTGGTGKPFRVVYIVT